MSLLIFYLLIALFFSFVCSLLESESRIFHNVMRFSQLRVKDIMTPRPVLFTLPENMTIGEILKKKAARLREVAGRLQNIWTKEPDIYG
jgi:hypothetical protein